MDRMALELGVYNSTVEGFSTGTMGKCPDFKGFLSLDFKKGTNSSLESSPSAR